MLTLPPSANIQIFSYLKLPELSKIESICTVIYAKVRNAYVYRQLVESNPFKTDIKNKNVCNLDFAGLVRFEMNKGNIFYMLSIAKLIQYSHIYYAAELARKAYEIQPSNECAQKLLLSLNVFNPHISINDQQLEKVLTEFNKKPSNQFLSNYFSSVLRATHRLFFSANKVLQSLEHPFISSISGNYLRLLIELQVGRSHDNDDELLSLARNSDTSFSHFLISLLVFENRTQIISVEKAAEYLVQLIEKRHFKFDVTLKAITLLFRGWSDGMLEDIVSNSMMYTLLSMVLIETMLPCQRSLLTLYQKCVFIQCNIGSSSSQNFQDDLASLEENFDSEWFNQEERAILILGYYNLLQKLNLLIPKKISFIENITKNNDKFYLCTDRTRFGILKISFHLKKILIENTTTEKNKQMNIDYLAKTVYPCMHNHYGCCSKEKIKLIIDQCELSKTSTSKAIIKKNLIDLEYVIKMADVNDRFFGMFLKADLLCENNLQSDLRTAYNLYERIGTFNKSPMPSAPVSMRIKAHFKQSELIIKEQIDFVDPFERINRYNKAEKLITQIIENFYSSSTQVNNAIFNLALLYAKRDWEKTNPLLMIANFDTYIENVKIESPKTIDAKFLQAKGYFSFNKPTTDTKAFQLFQCISQSIYSTSLQKNESLYYMAYMIYHKRHEEKLEEAYKYICMALHKKEMSPIMLGKSFLLKGLLLFYKQVHIENADDLALNSLKECIKYSSAQSEDWSFAHLHMGILGEEKRVVNFSLYDARDSLSIAVNFKFDNYHNEIAKKKLDQVIKQIKTPTLKKIPTKKPSVQLYNPKVPT